MRKNVVARIAFASVVASLFTACFSPPPPEQTDSSDTTASTTASQTTTSAPATTDTSATTASETSLAPTTSTSLPSTSAPDTDTTAPTLTTTDNESTTTTTTTTDADTGTTATDGQCGNGVVEPGEVCDDGNADDDDECLSNCVLATCGDGFVQIGVEACDDGNPDNTDDCVANCLAAFCGDGYNHAIDEECDDGNLVDGDGCDNDCAFEPCGNGVIDAPEICDDGNHLGGDGCSQQCQRDAAFVFVTTDSFTGAQMGDALAYATTLCDDERDALEASLPGVQALGTFKPWMSDNATSPAQHFLASTKPYVLPDGKLVANNWTDLIDGTLINAINVTSALTEIPLAGGQCNPDAVVWTGTNPMGQGLVDTCNNWSTTTGFNGTVGSARRATGLWTHCMGQSCILGARVYCFEQLM